MPKAIIKMVNGDKYIEDVRSDLLDRMEENPNARYLMIDDKWFVISSILTIEMLDE
jgi:uncharacterized protein YlzI (FlbEa/FlbD family)